MPPALAQPHARRQGGRQKPNNKRARAQTRRRPDTQTPRHAAVGPSWDHGIFMHTRWLPPKRGRTTKRHGRASDHGKWDASLHPDLGAQQEVCAGMAACTETGALRLWLSTDGSAKPRSRVPYQRTSAPLTVCRATTRGDAQSSRADQQGGGGIDNQSRTVPLLHPQPTATSSAAGLDALTGSFRDQARQGCRPAAANRDAQRELIWGSCMPQAPHGSAPRRLGAPSLALA